MWISLTTTNQTKTVVDFSKVLHANDHPNGTQIVFDASVPDKDNGAPTPKIIYVVERIEVIERTLRARKARK
ncbi:hypothetical protein [Sinorhizobium mexicanum]|uniref:Uncharacterized protein n=1 Tax=Sinorhizobium mexicanum TaxID=375549 RepID=A0A859QIM1_9HYPH|nr:hypothetical protein [Sinorhizobium mexicanum]MBP1884776.1 hypothetical protein [Sinorhizobium mexicanum]QLL65652.1 hypothetical protein FKV68_30605 [Sinorhizobium mexicanum]